MLWIVGSKGLLGSALVSKCRQVLQDQELLNELSDECKAALHSGVIETGKEVDITDQKALENFIQKHPKITHIINCAAYSLVDQAEMEKEKAYLINALGPSHLADLAQSIDAKLVHISTDYVFSGEEKTPLREEDKTGPVCYYGETKLEGEQIALKKGALVIRVSGLFGGAGKNFVTKLLEMIQTQKKIRLTDDQWGRFTYVPDLSFALLKMLSLKGLYQYANAGAATKYEFGIAMREEAFLLGFPIMTDAIIPVPGIMFPSPCKRPSYSVFDTSKIEKHVQIRHYRKAIKSYLCENLPAYL